jgi:hypothetical protein
LRSSKTFCLVEIIKVKKRQGVMEIVCLWTFGDGGMMTGSIVPRGLANRQTLPELVTWAGARHNRHCRLRLQSQATRAEGGARQEIQDAIILHAAEKIRKRLSRKEG